MPLQRSRRPANHATPLRSTLAATAHVCSLYNTPRDYLEVLEEFVGVGLERREKCLCLVSRPAEETFRRRIRAAGPRAA
jgi:hypothetical protein